MAKPPSAHRSSVPRRDELSTSGLTRRNFLRQTTLAATAAAATCPWPAAAASNQATAPAPTVRDLPRGNAPPPLPLPHFPDRLHAFVWRNWTLVPPARMAAAIGANAKDLIRLGHTMGLSGPPHISRDQWRRSYITILKRNWHLLPYDQLLTLLDWTPEQMAYTLREDDFLYVKLGNHKPDCAPLRYSAPSSQAQARAAAIARVLREEFPTGFPAVEDPLFGFVSRLSAPPDLPAESRPVSTLKPRFCYSYFALYGDPLLEPEADPYPDGYLARLAATGVDGVWLQAVLYKLAPFPWQPSLSKDHEKRLRTLRRFVERARKHGIGIWLYLNEPRAMPLAFFKEHPQLKGVAEGDHATLCTSQPAVQRYLTESVAAICRAVPDLAGFFTITASENLTNCWSHHNGSQCPRCAKRAPAEVIAEVNRLIQDGIAAEAQRRTPPANSGKPVAGIRLLAWDWGWNDAWAAEAVQRLPQAVSLMSVSEWSLPINRGGVASAVGEYSISAVGPGPRATRHWEFARKRGLKIIAKIQAGNTWELSAVPYIPAVENVARHAAGLRSAQVDGMMLGWTLGGCPSPNLEVIAEMGADPALTPLAAMQRVAGRRFGATLAPSVVSAWRELSAAFSEFPYHIGCVYSGPQQNGPANLLYAEPTKYPATMVGFPYDDLDGWRSIYPAETYAEQMSKVASGFEDAIERLRLAALGKDVSRRDYTALQEELAVAEAAAIHFRSSANQSRFVLARRALAAAQSRIEARAQAAGLGQVLRDELALARRQMTLQSRDSRLGFEASNQYYYVHQDLAEKVLNCRDLLDRWLPAQEAG